MARNWSLPLALAPCLALAADPPPSPALIQIGSAYVAKQYCSCLFVAGRSEGSCRAEFKPQIDLAKVAVDNSGLPDRAKVSVTMPGAVAVAGYSRRFGCVLEK
jgi:hypothetical protein